MTREKLSGEEKVKAIFYLFEVKGGDLYFKEFDFESEVSDSVFQKSGLAVGKYINTSYMGKTLYCRKQDAIQCIRTGEIPDRCDIKKTIPGKSREMASVAVNKYGLSANGHKIQTPPIELLLDAVEIRDNLLVWTDFSEAILGRKSRRCTMGCQVHAYYTQTSKRKTSGPSPYIRFSVSGINFQLPYGRAVIAVKNRSYPNGNVWMIGGDAKNLSADNFSENFISWWGRVGAEHPLRK